MFTQCPECGTVFRVTATVLRAAQGQVRCGVCDANFDALRFLTDAVDPEPAPPQPAATPPPPAAPAAPAPTPPPAARAPQPPAPAPPPPAPSPAAPAAPAARVPTPPPPPAARPPPAPPAVAPSAAAAPASPPARAAPPPPPPPAHRVVAPRPSAPPVPPARSAPPATRSTPSADEDRELAQIAAALARDAQASAARAARTAAPSAPTAPPRPPAAAPAEDNVLEPTDVEHIVLGGEGPPGEEIPDAALEFDVPPAEWDRVFVADATSRTITPLDINLEGLEVSLDDDLSLDADGRTETRAAPAVSAPRGAPPAAARAELALEDDDALSRTDEYAMLELQAGEEPAAGPASQAAPAAAADPDVHIEESWFDPATPSATPRATATHQRIEPVLAEEPLYDEPLVAEPVRRGDAGATRRWPQLAVAAALALLLIIQLVHYNRDALAATDLVGGPIKALYARLGQPLEPHWDLAAYDVKQWGAATDSAPGALRLRASVLNRAARAQPYPLLRVTLEDRFGAKVARREFTPAEYLPGHAAPQALLAPGARADADLSLADPGSQAVGFELDVCLLRGGALVCGTEQKAAGSG